jgi:hypothetical protein
MSDSNAVGGRAKSRLKPEDIGFDLDDRPTRRDQLVQPF